MTDLKLYVLLILSFAVSFPSQANTDQVSYTSNFNITHLDAIPQNEVFDIYKDSRGFMWVATLDGLVRYDGFMSKTYRMDMGKNSLSSNMIKGIAEDHRGNIWINTFGKGLCRLDVKKEHFTHFNMANNPFVVEDDHNRILIDPPYIWAGYHSTLVRYELDSTMSTILSSILLPAKKLGLVEDDQDIKSLHKSFDGSLWVGLNLNIIKIEKPYVDLGRMESQVFPYGVFTFMDYYPTMLMGGESLYFPQRKENGEVHIEFLRFTPGYISHQQNSTLWIGSTTGIDAYTWDENGLAKLSDLASYPPYDIIKGKKISCLESDNHGNLWVGSRGGGVDIISSKKRGIYHYAPNGNKGAVKSSLIKTVFEDSENNLWIGTEDKGLNFLKGNAKYNYASGFESYDIKNFPAEYNRAYAIAEQYTPESSKQNSLIWVGTSFPTFLMALDPATMQEKLMPPIIKQLGFVFAIAAQGDSVIWAGTYNKGLWKLKTNKEGDIISHQQFLYDEHDSTSIASDIIRNLLIDKHHNLWVSTDRGLSRLPAEEMNKDEVSFQNFSQAADEGNLSYDYLLQLLEGSDGQVWIGSMGGGLIGINQETGNDSISFFSVTTEDGLVDNTIKGIAEDADGYLWLSTNRGICKYHPLTKSVVSYDVEDGLQSNSFSELAVCKRSNGDLIFGGYEGFNVIRPDQLETDSIRPTMYFCDFQILNKVQDDGSLGQLNKDHNIEFVESILLRHDENSFLIGFSGLQFNAAHKNKYKYCLEGFDKVMTFTTAQNSEAKYTNIPAGEYQFKVWGANCDNIWTTHPIILTIRVKSHPLKSPLAWGCYVLLVVLAFYVAFKIIHLFHLRKNEMAVVEIEKKKTEDLTQSKLRFFTNISHEFRTPLTLISIPLEKILNSSQSFSDDTGKNLSTIHQNTKVLLRLVNQILDFRKLEQNEMVLQAQKEDVIPFVEEVAKAYSSLLQDKKIVFCFTHQQETLVFDFDAEKLEKILNNLIYNAIKFTPEEGRITLHLSSDDEYIKLSISDTGPGILPEEQELIFVRYHQQTLQQTREHGGTGIGLSLTKALVELHGGEIILESTLGTGCTFTVTLPRQQDLSKVEHLTDMAESKNEEVKPPIETSDEEELSASPVQDYKLLIVEDNKDLRELISSIFEPDYTVYQAKDGQEGYQLCHQHKPDIIISDVMMPRMSGIELLSLVKSEEEISHIPVILLTAKNTIEDQVIGHLAGADAYLPKPFNIKVLQAKVHAVFENRERLKLRYKKEIEINPLVVANSPGDVDFMERLLKVIEKDIVNPEFNVDMMAINYGTSRSNLNRKIKALTGETPIQFLRNIRLKHAADLLTTTDISVSTAAWEVGFIDLANFRKHFKSRYGVSPSAFANHNKG